MKYNVNLSFVIKKLMERLNLDERSLSVLLNVDERTIRNYINSHLNPSIDTFDKIVSLIESNNLDIYELFDFDGDYLFHGSRSGLVGTITTHLNYDLYNDFANGFYLSSSFKNALTYVISNKNSVVYRFHEKDVITHKILYLDKRKEKDQVDWVIYIGLNRGKILSKEDEHFFRQFFLNKFDEYDVLIGEIADSYNFDVLDDFFMNQCDIVQVRTALTLANIGDQYVIKNEKVANELHYIDEYHIEKRLRNYLINKKRVTKDNFVNIYREQILVREIDKELTFNKIKERLKNERNR